MIDLPPWMFAAPGEVPPREVDLPTASGYDDLDVWAYHLLNAPDSIVLPPRPGMALTIKGVKWTLTGGPSTLYLDAYGGASMIQDYSPSVITIHYLWQHPFAALAGDAVDRGHELFDITLLPGLGVQFALSPAPATCYGTLIGHYRRV